MNGAYRQTDRSREGDLGAALADDDGAGLGELVAVNLDPEALALGVPAVLGAPGPLLVRHLDGQPARRQRRHAHAPGGATGERGAVAAEEGGGGREGQVLEGSHQRERHFCRSEKKAAASQQRQQTLCTG